MARGKPLTYKDIKPTKLGAAYHAKLSSGKGPQPHAKQAQWVIDPKQKKKVWRPGAHVNAVVLVSGRIEGTWRYDRKVRGLNVSVEPFS